MIGQYIYNPLSPLFPLMRPLSLLLTVAQSQRGGAAAAAAHSHLTAACRS